MICCYIPSYSPDLAMSNIHQFLKMKKTLAKKFFLLDDKVNDIDSKYMADLNRTEFYHSLMTLERHWSMGINDK